MDEANVDAICMWLLKNPKSYDVLVAPNLYGDVISDLCAQMVGGLGFGCSGNIGMKLGVFEPSHGSAPKYTGQNKVNPIATILAAKMMLDWLGEAAKGRAVEAAVAKVLAEGQGPHVRHGRHPPPAPRWARPSPARCRRRPDVGSTAVEKILARASGKRTVKAGDVVEPRVDLAMSHENAALVINQFQEIYEGTGLPAKPWDPSRIAIIFDHRVPAESAKTATNQKRVRAFVAEHGITKFHDIRGDVGGICHQILPERGYVRPGMVVVGTDSHTTSHGALGAFAFGIGATEMASVWALGVALNVEVPATIRVEVVRHASGRTSARRTSSSTSSGMLTAQGANFRVLEFTGETIANLSTSGRLVLCNMSVEAGATAGIVPGDAETVRYLREEAGVTDPLDLVTSDADATYERIVKVDVSTLEPLVACPHTVDNVKPVSAVAGKPVQQVVIGSCTNGRLDDLAEAAAIVRGQHVAAGNAHARLPGLREDLGRGAEARLPHRLHGRRRRRHERGLRPVPRRPRGRARRRRDGDLDDEPELQGADGEPGRGGLPRVARRRGGVGPHGRHHRPAEGALTWPARRRPRRPSQESRTAA